MNMIERMVYEAIPHGKENAIYSSEIEGITGLKGSDVRLTVNRLRTTGVPICSSKRGYFIAENPSDILETIEMLNGRCNAILSASNGLNNYYLSLCKEKRLQSEGI